MLVRLHHGAGGFQRPERAGEGHLLVIVDGLVAEHQHAVLLHAEVDALQGLGIGNAAQVDAAHLGHEHRVQGGEAQGHVELRGWTRRVAIGRAAQPGRRGRPSAS